MARGVPGVDEDPARQRRRAGGRESGSTSTKCCLRYWNGAHGTFPYSPAATPCSNLDVVRRSAAEMRCRRYLDRRRPPMPLALSGGKGSTSPSISGSDSRRFGSNGTRAECLPRMISEMSHLMAGDNRPSGRTSRTVVREESSPGRASDGRRRRETPSRDPPRRRTDRHFGR
jgi:hypothetical protein